MSSRLSSGGTGGSVSSVGLSTSSVLHTVSGSPVTGSGTIALTLKTQAAHALLAGPTTGADATPTMRALVTTDLPSSAQTAALAYVIDGGGSVITTGIAGDIVAPFGCTITASTLLADQTGSIVVDVWKAAYASYPPTVANTITASALPTISSALKSQDSTLTGWTTSVSAGDVLRVNVNSCSAITRCALVLSVSRA